MLFRFRNSRKVEKKGFLPLQDDIKKPKNVLIQGEELQAKGRLTLLGYRGKYLQLKSISDLWGVFLVHLVIVTSCMKAKHTCYSMLQLFISKRINVTMIEQATYRQKC